LDGSRETILMNLHAQSKRFSLDMVLSNRNGKIYVFNLLFKALSVALD